MGDQLTPRVFYLPFRRAPSHPRWLLRSLDLADKLHELISQYAEKSASQKRLEAIREMLHNPPSHSSSSSSSGGYYSS